MKKATELMTIKVLLVEDHDIVREGINSLLQSDEEISVVGEARNGSEAIEKIDSLDPDVIVMDMNMPVMNGLECTKFIRQNFPDKKILILSMHEHENYLIDLLDAGASGYILKNSSKNELVFAIKKIANNGMYMGAEFTMNMLAKYKSSGSYRAVTGKQLNISDRESDVLNLIAQGKTNAEIANELFTSVRTIETRRKKLLEKTNTTNTATLIKFAFQSGLLK
jgi:DNA-binding NarL/FixJ family response regulator